MNNLVFYTIILFLFLLAFTLYYNPHFSNRFPESGTKLLVGAKTQELSRVNSCVSCTAKNSLLPITNPAFNLREAAKQMILLEDHLSNKGKLCDQCIIKHSLTIEGYLEEAISLDDTDKYCAEINDILVDFRKIEHGFLYGKSPQKLAHKLRDIRKKIHVKYFAVGI
jgi:hypothetical protein